MPAVSVLDSVSTEILAADYQRTIAVITNSHATSNLHISLGGTATTNDAYISPNGNMTIAGDRIFKGAINGISSSGTITAKYSKVSPGT